MPSKLLKIHQADDRAVTQVYGMPIRKWFLSIEKPCRMQASVLTACIISSRQLAARKLAGRLCIENTSRLFSTDGVFPESPTGT